MLGLILIIFKRYQKKVTIPILDAGWREGTEDGKTGESLKTLKGSSFMLDYSVTSGRRGGEKHKDGD